MPGNRSNKWVTVTCEPCGKRRIHKINQISSKWECVICSLKSPEMPNKATISSTTTSPPTVRQSSPSPPVVASSSSAKDLNEAVAEGSMRNFSPVSYIPTSNSNNTPEPSTTTISPTPSTSALTSYLQEIDSTTDASMEDNEEIAAHYSASMNASAEGMNLVISNVRSIRPSILRSLPLENLHNRSVRFSDKEMHIYDHVIYNSFKGYNHNDSENADWDATNDASSSNQDDSDIDIDVID